MRDVIQVGFAKAVRAAEKMGAGRVPGAATIYRALHKRINRGEIRLLPLAEHDLSMYVDMGDIVIAGHLLATGVWEPEETLLFTQAVNRDSFVIDVGANIGYYTLLAAKRGATVYAFEPEPHNFDLLQRNIALNDFENVAALRQAVANISGKGPLYMNDANLGAHSLIGSAVPVKVGEVEVELVTLDDLADEVGNRSLVVKMDVQGAEGLVCQGGRRLFSLPVETTVFMEFWPEAIASSGIDPLAHLRWFKDAGYSLQIVGGEVVTPEQAVEACRGHASADRYVNLVLHR